MRWIKQDWSDRGEECLGGSTDVEMEGGEFQMWKRGRGVGRISLLLIAGGTASSFTGAVWDFLLHGLQLESCGDKRIQL